jgi:hypothetical protein
MVCKANCHPLASSDGASGAGNYKRVSIANASQEGGSDPPRKAQHGVGRGRHPTGSLISQMTNWQFFQIKFKLG